MVGDKTIKTLLDAAGFGHARFSHNINGAEYDLGIMARWEIGATVGWHGIFPTELPLHRILATFSDEMIDSCRQRGLVGVTYFGHPQRQRRGILQSVTVVGERDRSRFLAVITGIRYDDQSGLAQVILHSGDDEAAEPSLDIGMAVETALLLS